jgi:hypothetical protein
VSSPINMMQYLTRFKKNERISGFGIEKATVHMPCPFCAATDFLVYRIIDVHEALAKGATCKECKRSLGADQVGREGCVTVSFYQSGGPDQPEWLEPKMPDRRPAP